MQNKILVKSDEGQYAPGNGTRTITLSELSFTPKIEQIAYIYNKTQDKLYYSPAVGIAKCTISGLVITIDGAFPVLATTDEIHIQLWLPARAYDTNQDVKKVNIENDLPGNKFPEESLVSGSDIGASNDTYKDQGAEIDCDRIKTVGLFILLTVNDSTGNQLQVLVKYENGGSDEFELDLSSDFRKTLGNVDKKIYLPFGVVGIAFIQVQTKATVVDTGGGTPGTVTINTIKEY